MTARPSISHRSPLSGFLVAFVTTFAIFAIRHDLSPALKLQALLFPFILAMTISAWFGGLWLGLTSALVSVVLFCRYDLVSKTGLLPDKPAESLWIGIFLLESFVISLVIELLRRSRVREELRDAEEKEIALRLQEKDDRLNLVVSHARCILWQAAIDAADPLHIAWRQEVLNENAAQGILPFDAPAPGSYLGAWAAAVHPEDRLRLDESAFDHLTSGKLCYRQEFRCTDRNGDEHWIHEHITLQPIGPRQWQAFGVSTDMTEQRRLAETMLETQQALEDQAAMLIAADDAKDRFLAMLAHELRNPLSPILNSIYLLQTGKLAGGAVERAHAVIDRQTRHMARLVDDLLDVSRIACGKIELRKTDVDLNAVARDVVSDWKESVAAKELRLVTELDAHPLLVLGDSARMVQIFGNLLNNAVKFTNPGGSITLRTYRRGNGAVAEVEDTGIGIDAAQLSKIFDIFVQSDRSLDRSDGGLGLGLALVRGLAEMHGGRVAAESKGVGLGSRFRVELPLVPDAAARPSRMHPDDTPPAMRARILIIEDNRDAAESLRDLLDCFGHDASMAFTGEEGIASAAAIRPDLIVCDVGLPGRDGYAVAREIRMTAGLSTVKMIAATGYGAEEDRQHANEAGFDAHLTKPIDPELLQRMVARLLENHDAPGETGFLGGSDLLFELAPTR